MPNAWTSGVSSSSARTIRFVLRQPSWVARAALFAALFVFLAVLALLIIPAMVIGIAVFILMAIAARIRRLFTGLRSPNGALDGRKNVRVIVRE